MKTSGPTLDDILGEPLGPAIDRTIAQQNLLSLDDGQDDITLLKTAKSLLLRTIVKQLQEGAATPMVMSVLRGLLQDNAEVMALADDTEAEKEAMEEVLRRRREDMAR